MASHGYAFFAIGERGILRVSTLRETVDGGSNYLFVKSAPDHRFIPYTDAQDLPSTRSGADVCAVRLRRMPRPLRWQRGSGR